MSNTSHATRRKRTPHPPRAKSNVQTTLIVTQIEGQKVGVVLRVTHLFPNKIALMGALRAFIGEWGKTPEGRKAHKESHRDFNWGDFAHYCESLVIANVVSIRCLDHAVEVVDHDELLIHE